MKIINAICIFSLTILINACGDQAERPASEDEAEASATDPAIVTITAKDMRFDAPSTLPSGWTRFRFDNLDPMIHFAMLVRLPDGVTAQNYSDDLGPVFQKGYDHMIAGDEAATAATFAQVPAWVGDMVWFGGPGFQAAGSAGETSIFLTPGNYVIECYIKTGGIFHSYSPVRGELAMLFPLTVTDETSTTAEPEAGTTLVINETGYRLEGDAPGPGDRSIRVRFDTGMRYPSFVGQDVHIVRLTGENDLQAALDWMDWRHPEGLSSPAPVTFVGGVNDMPAGSTAYIHLELSPGRYAFIAEVPDAREKGMVLEFSIP